MLKRIVAEKVKAKKQKDRVERWEYNKKSLDYFMYTINCSYRAFLEDIKSPRDEDCFGIYLEHDWDSILRLCKEGDKEERLKYLANRVLKYLANRVLKYLANRVLNCDELWKKSMDKIMSAMITLDCSAETIRWWLEQGANPNGDAAGIEIYIDEFPSNLCRGSTMMILAAAYSANDTFAPRIFYWLVVYGGEISIIPQCDGDHGQYYHYCSYKNIVDILETRNPCEADKKDIGSEEDENKKGNNNGSGTEIQSWSILAFDSKQKEKKLKALEELKRGIKDMKRQVENHCLILPPLLDICFSYLSWPKKC